MNLRKNHTSYFPGQEDQRVILYYDKVTFVILGCQIVGTSGVVGRVNTVAAGINKQMTTKELAYLDLCYAPPFSRTWDILNVAGNVAK